MTDKNEEILHDLRQLLQKYNIDVGMLVVPIPEEQEFRLICSQMSEEHLYILGSMLVKHCAPRPHVVN